MCNSVDPSKGLFGLLPKEITTHILHQLEFHHLKTCALVCKFFKNLTGDKEVIQKHPLFNNYLRDIGTNKTSDLLCKNEKFFDALKKANNGQDSFAKGVVQGYTWCYLFNEGKTSVDDTELETLRTKILTSTRKWASDGHPDFN